MADPYVPHILSLRGHLIDVACAVPVVFGPIPAGIFVAESAAVRLRPVSHAALTVLVVWSLAQAVVALAAGLAGRYDFTSVALAEIALFCAGVVTCVRSSPLIVFRGLGAGGSNGVGNATAVRAGGALLGAVTAVFFFRVAGHAITDYDSLAYHLPPVARWIQTGSTRDLGAVTYHYPYTWEAVAGLFALPFGDDFLVDFPNWVAWIVFVVGCYRVARDIGARSDGALAAAMLVGASPVARDHVSTLHVDLALGAFFVAGLHYALSLGSPRERGLAWGLLVACAGLVVAVKTSGIIYAALLGPVVLVASSLRRQSTEAGQPDPHAQRVAGMLGAVSVSVAAYWYVAWMSHGGNPLGEVELRVGRLTLIPGRLHSADVARTTFLHLFEPGDARHWAIVWHVVQRELGLPFASWWPS